MSETTDASPDAVGAPVERPVRPRADIARVMAAVWDLVRSGPNFDGRQRDVEIVVAAEIDRAVAAERARVADMCGDMAAVSWAEWDAKADPADQGKALALEHVAALLEGPNAELTGPRRREAP